MEKLPDEMVLTISSFLNPESVYLLRLTSKRFRDVIKKPENAYWDLRLIDYGSFMNNIEICKLAERWFDIQNRIIWKYSLDQFLTVIINMLTLALERKDEQSINLAKEWNYIGSECLLITAANVANISVCRLAKKWGAINYNRMLENAKYCIRLCAKQNEPKYAECVKICLLAIKWGAENYNLKNKHYYINMNDLFGSDLFRSYELYLGTEADLNAVEVE